MRKHRILSAILAICMLMSVVPAYAAETEETANDSTTGSTTVITDELSATEEDDTSDDAGTSEETADEDTESSDETAEDGTEVSEDNTETEEESSSDSNDDTATGQNDEEEEKTQQSDQTDNTSEQDTETSTETDTQNTGEEEEEEEEEEPVTYPTVTFDLGDSQVEVELEGDTIPADSIPATDEDGNEVIRWYLSDLSAVVDPEELTVTEDITLVAWYAPALRSDHGAYMSGYGDGSFGPEDSLTRAQVAQILYNLLADQSEGSFPSAWSDVDADDWYYTAVTVTSSLGFFDADGGNFDPDTEITRGEFVSIVTRLVKTVEDAENIYSDLSESDENYDAIMTASSLGWVNGMDDGTFSADTVLTRAQAVTIFNRIMDRTADSSVLSSGDGIRVFSDVSSSAWYYTYVMEATIDHTASTSGSSETWTSYTHTLTVTFVVDSETTTQQVYPGDTAFSSQIPTANASGTSISRWTVDGTNVMGDPYVDAITAEITYTAWYSPSLTTEHLTYVSGYGDGTFGPDDALTRAEACQMVYALLSSQSQGSYYSYYSDVSSDAWYYEAITTLASLDLITATGGEYGPNEEMSRAEFAELISRLTVLSHSSNSFPDVDTSSEYYYAISTVNSKGWITGMDDGTFSPDSSLTRAQAVTILNRVTSRYGDSDVEYDMDDRYTFTDVSTSHWAYIYIMEAATDHEYTLSGSSETWTGYSHSSTGTVDWEDSDSVVSAASIILTYSSTYSGDYTHNYNVDYSTQAKEDYVNSKGYSSSTGYLIWVSRACQKVYIFEGSQYNWTLIKTFICGTGKSSSQTPVGVTYITYKQTGWYLSSYTVAPVVRFYPGTGYAFHSRLYYPGSSTLKDASIGYPISHGCVRMLTPDVTYIYNYMPVNTTVVIY